MTTVETPVPGFARDFSATGQRVMLVGLGGLDLIGKAAVLKESAGTQPVATQGNHTLCNAPSRRRAKHPKPPRNNRATTVEITVTPDKRLAPGWRVLCGGMR